MPIDRAATLRQAEKLLRQGKLDLAIAEYLHLVGDQPRDWNTANLLGDLYVRAGQLDRAIEQFSRIADGVRNEGFLPKASALYKKILKLRPDDDHALMQAAELAAEQGLLADARAFFATAAGGRRRRGDVAGALTVTVRLGTLDKADTEARLASAHARLELDDVQGAIDEFTELAAALVAQGRDADAVAPLQALVKLSPSNEGASGELARLLIALGRSDEAMAYLTPEAASADPGTRDSAYRAVEVLVNACIERGDWTGAADLLVGFAERAPAYVPALTQLVEVCVEGGLHERIIDAQSRLADAYLSAGDAVEARYVAEDLLTREPWERRHFTRLRAALEAAGEPDPDRAVADWLAGTTTFGTDETPAVAPDVERVEAADVLAVAAEVSYPVAEPAATLLETTATLVEVLAAQVETSASEIEGAPPVRAAAADWQAPSAATSRNPHAIDMDLVFGRPTAATTSVEPASIEPSNIEEDLSAVLDQARPSVPPAPAPAAPAESSDVEMVFENLRDQAAHRPGDEPAQMAYVRGVALFEAGEPDASIDQLRIATRSPHQRFAAATLLARIFQEQNRTPEAIEWLGHAVDAPEVTSAQRHDALIRLADLLESSGEPASALAVCLELQAEAGDFRDVAARVARLSQASGG